MHTVLTMSQIIFSLALILLIIMQSKGAGLGSTFGGSGMFYRSKRGVEKIIYRATIVCSILLGLSSLLLLIYR